VAIIITRRMSGADAPSMLMWSALTGVVVLSFIVPFVFVMPSLHQLGLAVAVGVLATAGQYFMVLAYRHAAASVLAPFSYVQMLYAIVSGFLVFGALPDGLTLLGGGIVAVSGLWSAQNERRVARGGSTPAA
jgi:drug/metabolite transporter (DMT)-like permease